MPPLHYLHPGLRPSRSTATPTPVPYEQAVRLRDPLTKAGVPSQLVTVPGGGHGRLPAEWNLRAYGAIENFLKRAGVTP